MNNDTYCKRVENETILRGFNKKGEIALCCKSQNPLPMDVGFEEIKKVKTALDKGEKHWHCNFCWKQEAAGIFSWRQIGNQQNFDYKFVELYLDNTCDLACVYCSPKYSSSWAQEIKQANNNNIDLQDFVNKEHYDVKKEEYNHTPKILSYIEQIGKESKTSKPVYIMLLGGEPLLSSMFKKDVITEIINAFYKQADDNTFLGLNIVTNCNTPDAIIDKAIHKIKQHKKTYKNLDITINVSIEGTGERAEYIRYGLDWNQFHKNLRKWLITKEVVVCFSMAVNAISWKSTPGFFEWVFYIVKEHGQKTGFQFNTVMFPQHLSIKMLPHNQFYIFDEIHNIFNKNRDLFLSDEVYDRAVLQIEQAKKDFGKTSRNKDLAKTAIGYLDYIKNHRNKDIKNINPELYEHLNEIVNG